MKKIHFVILVLLLFSPAVFPQNIELGFEIPVQLKSNEVGEGNGVNFSAEYKFDGFMSLKTTFGGISDKTTGKDLVPGTYSMFWAEESAEIRSTSGTIEPYCGVGLGYYKTDINLASPELAGQDQPVVSDNIKYTFGYNVRGGLDILLGRYLILNTEIKYIIFDPTMTVTNNDINPPEIKSENIDLNSVILQAGVEAGF